MHCVLVSWLIVVLGLPVSKCDLPYGAAGYAFIEPVVAIRIDYDYYPRLWTADAKTAIAVFTLAHELGHVRQHSPSERVANQWARKNWCQVITMLRPIQFNLPTCSQLWLLLPSVWKNRK